MEGFVGVVDLNCDSDKYVKCFKCSIIIEKYVFQLIIDEKYKQKNQEILERKYKFFNVGRNLFWKISELELY